MPKAHKLVILIFLTAAAGCAQVASLPTDEPQISSTSAPAATLPPAWTSTSTIIATAKPPAAATTEFPATVTTTQEPTREAGSADDTPTSVPLKPFDIGGSPDQPIVAFSSSREGNIEIFVMRLDGSGLRRLTEDKDEDNYPRWSPDGYQLAFNSWRETAEDTIGFSKVWLINADGSDERLFGITKAALFPSWSPDGSLLAIQETTDLGLYRSDGSQLRWLHQGIGIVDRYPDWSPDGRRIAFSSHNNTTDQSNIYLINSTGGAAHLQADAARLDVTPSWSPDGEWIAFSSNDSFDADWDLNLMRSDGSGLTTLTKGFYPRWSPDGEWISFSRTDERNTDIFIIHPDGTGERRVTDWSGFDGYLDWRPTGEQGG